MQRKTRADVERLKENWAAHPDWDLEDAQGYGEYREELLAYSREWKIKWEMRDRARWHKIAGEELGIPGEWEVGKKVEANEVEIDQCMEKSVGALYAPIAQAYDEEHYQGNLWQETRTEILEPLVRAATLQAENALLVQDAKWRARYAALERQVDKMAQMLQAHEAELYTMRGGK